MPISDILTLLEAERDRLDRAIEVLRGSALGSRRGKPAATPTTSNGAGVRRRRSMSAAARKALSEKLRASWAKRKRAAAAKKA